MQRAGAACASEIALRYAERLGAGVLVAAGPGNNGGDAWVVARALAATGVRVRVVEPVSAKTDDARAESALARAIPTRIEVTNAAEFVDRGEALVIDGLLGTGSRGSPRGDIATIVSGINAMRDRGAVVVAIDIPSGVDASTGAADGDFVVADLTLTFGTMKRGLLARRDACGTTAVLDIGLGSHAELEDGAPSLVDERWVSASIPAISSEAHKGTRKKLAIVGGAAGMAGASVLAARAALRSGIGMVKLVVAPESLSSVQEAEPYALATTWPSDEATLSRDVIDWADAVVIGPGLGRTDESKAILERVLAGWHGPTLLDADAITVFENRLPDLAKALAKRRALLTPHPVEFSRLAGLGVEQVLKTRFDVGLDVARALGAAVLIKGVPTVVNGPDGRRLVSASGTAALATAGSGDVLSGIAGTLLAQIDDPLVAGAVAAWVHGRAAQRVPMSTAGGVRGVTLEDVIAELRDAWHFDDRSTRYPVLVELPAAGGTP